MPVPSAITDLSQTAGSNSPAGSESPNTADDYFRAHASFIAQLRDGKNFSDPTSLASAGTTDIGAENSMFVQITGTTTITSFGTNYNGPRFLRFSGALTLTHNATTLNLPGGANITTAAGDSCIAVPNSTPNGWNVVSYMLASGRALVAPSAASESAAGIVELATDAEAQAGTSTSVVLTPANMKAAQIQIGTAVASTSGTAIDFTGIPSWAKRVTVMLSGVSTNAAGSSNIAVQIGDSGGIENTGYTGVTSTLGASTIASGAGNTAGFHATSVIAAAATFTGKIVIERMDGNLWVATANVARTDSATISLYTGSKTLTATLDRVRITTFNGTDAFDAGSVNISWE